jgi:MarR family transcriptional regulator, lower aerobic nicotinate degradation pathway regulator
MTTSSAHSPTEIADAPGATTMRAPQRVAKELATNSGFLLARLGFGFKARATARLDEAGFELYDYGILALLDEGVRETQATFAEALALDASRLVALLDSLEARGLIVRQRDPQDRRRHVVSITAAGERELSRLRAISRRLEDEFFAPLDSSDRQVFQDLLVRLAAHNDPSCTFVSTEAEKAAKA